MSVSFRHPSFLLLLVAGAPLVYMAWRRWPPPLSRGRSRLALGLRLGMAALLILALADMAVSRAPTKRATIAVVDLSDSVRGSEEDAAAAVRALLGAKGPDDLFGVVTFGRDAKVEVPPSRRPTFAGFQTRPDPSYSGLGDALRLAANLIPEGYGRQLVLVSDGRQNLGDAAEAIAALRARSVRVDVVPTGAPPGPEVAVVALEAPGELRVDQSLTATAQLRASSSATGTLRFQLDGRDVEARPVTLPAGASAQALDLPPLPAGTHRLGVTLDAEPDGYSQNDQSEAVVRVVDRPRVLVLEGDRGSGANVAAALTAGGMTVESRPSEETPVEAAALAAYESFVVVDAPVEAFPAGALEALATSVRELGRGLVAVGGTRSYGPGGWKDTPLERVLPVRMEIPQPKERPAIAAVLVMETTEISWADVVALGAAESVVDQLTPDDEFAMVRLGGPGGNRGEPAVSVPLTKVTDKVAIKRQLRTTELGDPAGYGSGLNMALDVLSRSEAPNKHLVLFGDGDAVADVGPTYDAIFGRARAGRVTVTSVGVDTHADASFMSHMRDVGRLGGGRFYESSSAKEVPAILLEASRTTLRPWFEQTPFFPSVTSAGDVLAGVPLDSFPEVGGYVVSTPKPSAEVVLATPKRDPLLAAGQHGLGRTVAWTSDAGGRWSAGLLASPVGPALFGRMVAWTLPAGTGGDLSVDARPQGDGLDVSVTSGSAGGGDVRLGVVAPDGKVTSVPLRAVGPRRWQGSVRTGAVGSYVLHPVLRRGEAVAAQAEVTVSVPYSPEYLETGRDDGLLRQLAGQGGALLAAPTKAWSLGVPHILVSSAVFWLLLLVFAVLWPLDIALRRLTLSPPKLWVAVRKRRTQRGDERSAEAPSTPLRTQPSPRREPPPPKADINDEDVAEERDEPTPRREPARTLSSRLLEVRRRQESGEEPDPDEAP